MIFRDEAPDVRGFYWACFLCDDGNLNEPEPVELNESGSTSTTWGASLPTYLFLWGDALAKPQVEAEGFQSAASDETSLTPS